MKVKEDFIWGIPEGKNPLRQDEEKPSLSYLILLERYWVLFTLSRLFDRRVCEPYESTLTSGSIPLPDLQKLDFEI